MNHWVNQYQKGLEGLYDAREAKNIAYWALQHICDCGMTEILMGKCDQLSERENLRMEEVLTRLSKGEPLQHIFGESEFHGLTFHVNGDVLIPRPETAELVDWIHSDYKGQKASFIDIGTGSGCIAITLKHLNEGLTAHAMDVSTQALKVAQSNAERIHTEIDFVEDDILKPKAFMEKLDFIVSNPPYITEEEKQEMRRNVLDYEPHLALFVENPNPLLFYEAIADYGTNHLKEGGNLYFEINEHFGKKMCDMLARRGYEEIEVRRDMQGKERMIKCSRKR